MAILGETLLFLLPFAAFLLWRKLYPEAEPSRVLLALAALGVALAAAGAIWYGLNRRLDTDRPYQPAQLRDGQIVR